VIDEARKRVPVIIGVTGSCRELAVAYAQQAEDAGADGLIALPPYVLKADREGIYAYFKAISDAVHLPIFVQNAPPPLGSSLSPALMVQMCREIEHVDYIKEETIPTAHYISAILRQAGPELKGIFGGAAGRWMLPELERGACGFMPACQLTDIYVQIWDLWESGNRDGARTLFNKLLPIINLEAMLSVNLAKEILVRRKVIATPYVRRPDGVALDQYDILEMERCLADIEPYYTVVL
jgi:4-hydroxy-tetrahydrodipicolinate synthase